LSLEKITYLGNLAINKSEILGINDPLTHLCQYLEKGEAAITGIKIDLETDVAERLPKTPFINHVGFKLDGDDFISVKDKVSMKSMTQSNLEVLKTMNIIQDQEIKRAEIEADEVRKLADWYKDAPVHSYMIFESLPIGNQKIAISRIYQKKPDGMLNGSFVSLHNPSVDSFNRLRQEFNPSLNDCVSEIDILENSYSFYSPNLKSPDDFIDFYVDTYDQILLEKSGVKRKFGLSNSTEIKTDGLKKIKNQPKLSEIYIDAIHNLAASGGLVSPELSSMNEKLGLKYPFEIGSKIQIDSARGFLSDVIKGIASVIDNADGDFLRYLEFNNSNTNINYDAISTFQVQSAGYDSLACPEFINIESSVRQAGFEQESMLRAFNIWETLDFFGKPKIDICKTNNCPSHGKISPFKDRTVVGGCGFCVECHKILQNHKSPEQIYQEKIKKQELKTKQKKELSKNNKTKAA
jgi:hypothetical protein